MAACVRDLHVVLGSAGKSSNACCRTGVDQERQDVGSHSQRDPHLVEPTLFDGPVADTATANGCRPPSAGVELVQVDAGDGVVRGLEMGEGGTGLCPAMWTSVNYATKFRLPDVIERCSNSTGLR